jgi:hypothetical protein
MPICVSHIHEICQSIACGRDFGDSRAPHPTLHLTPIIDPLDDLRIHSDSDQDSESSFGTSQFQEPDSDQDSEYSWGTESVTDEDLAGDNAFVLQCLIGYRDYATGLPECLEDMLREHAPQDTDPVYVTDNKQALFKYIRSKIQEYSEHEVLLNSHIELIEGGTEDCQVPWVKEFFLNSLDAGREVDWVAEEIYYKEEFIYQAPSEPSSDEDE